MTTEPPATRHNQHTLLHTRLPDLLRGTKNGKGGTVRVGEDLGRAPDGLFRLEPALWVDEVGSEEGVD
jgi:hypothetical protein